MSERMHTLSSIRMHGTYESVPVHPVHAAVEGEFPE